ncbi:MAG: hypothetical protein ABIF17_03800 [Patescibacteria group bacterium]
MKLLNLFTKEKEKLSTYNGKLQYRGTPEQTNDNLIILLTYLAGYKITDSQFINYMKEQNLKFIQYNDLLYPEWAILDANQLLEENDMKDKLIKALELKGLHKSHIPPLSALDSIK